MLHLTHRDRGTIIYRALFSEEVEVFILGPTREVYVCVKEGAKRRLKPQNTQQKKKEGRRGLLSKSRRVTSSLRLEVPEERPTTVRSMDLVSLVLVILTRRTGRVISRKIPLTLTLQCLNIYVHSFKPMSLIVKFLL